MKDTRKFKLEALCMDDLIITSQYKWRIIAFIVGGAGMKEYSHIALERKCVLTYLLVCECGHTCQSPHVKSREKL